MNIIVPCPHTHENEHLHPQDKPEDSQHDPSKDSPQDPPYNELDDHPQELSPLRIPDPASTHDAPAATMTTPAVTTEDDRHMVVYGHNRLGFATIDSEGDASVTPLQTGDSNLVFDTDDYTLKSILLHTQWKRPIPIQPRQARNTKLDSALHTSKYLIANQLYAPDVIIASHTLFAGSNLHKPQRSRNCPWEDGDTFMGICAGPRRTSFQLQYTNAFIWSSTRGVYLLPLTRINAAYSSRFPILTCSPDLELTQACSSLAVWAKTNAPQVKTAPPPKEGSKRRKPRNSTNWIPTLKLSVFVGKIPL